MHSLAYVAGKAFTCACICLCIWLVKPSFCIQIKAYLAGKAFIFACMNAKFPREVKDFLQINKRWPIGGQNLQQIMQTDTYLVGNTIIFARISCIWQSLTSNENH